MKQLDDLMVFNVEKNQISGPLPDLSSLTKLEALGLKDNQLQGALAPLPPQLRQISICPNPQLLLGGKGKKSQPLCNADASATNEAVQRAMGH